MLRRLVFSALVVAGTVAADGSASVIGKPQCPITDLHDANAPIRAPLVARLGTKLVDTISNFITDTPFGKLLFGTEAQTCIANFNGTMVGSILLDQMTTPTCAKFANLTDVPFVKFSLDALTANATTVPSFNDVLQYFKNVSNAQMDQFCGLYTTSIIPCIVTELLPALSVVRSRYSNGCCDAWNDHVLTTYGYTISGQLIKMAELFGDAVCAQQTPGFGKMESQRCGYTALQTWLTKPDTASFATTLLRNLQVPTNQMCLRAEGQAYTDTNGNSVGPSDPFPSGCVVTLDRITTWMYSLPWTQHSQSFDVKALLEDGKCLQGSEFYPTIKYLLPQIASTEVEVYFNKSCVHLPMGFGDKCNYTRSALLVEWTTEPQPVGSARSMDDQSPTTSSRTPTTPPVMPKIATTSSTGRIETSIFTLLLTVVVTVRSFTS